MPEPAEAAMLREALGRLSPDHRAVVALHLHAGYSVDETARLLQVPFDTVRSRLRAAREQLRGEMTEVTP
jgi:RNA polymerase sigma-70 factor (ECF subfamily)